jgi:hypothetical protein
VGLQGQLVPILLLVEWPRTQVVTVALAGCCGTLLVSYWPQHMTNRGAGRLRAQSQHQCTFAGVNTC